MAIRPTRNNLPFLAAAFLAALPAAAAAPDALTLLDAALTAPEHSYQGHLTVTEWFGKQTRAEEVEVSYSPTNRYRWEFLAPDGSAARVAVSDGSNEQILLVRQGKAVTGEAVRSSTKLMIPEREKELLLKNYRLSVTGPDMTAGRKTWVLDLQPLVAGKPRQLLWIDAQTDVTLAIKRYLPRKQFAILSRFTHFTIKPSLPEETFRLQLASPSIVSGDMTPDFLSIDELEKTTGRETDLPEALPGGFVFESADYFEVNKDMVRHLRYTDGLAVLSIFLTDRPVRLPPGGTMRLDPRLSPPGSLRLSSTGKVFAFKRGSQHYTMMSDVSRDLLESIAARLTAPKPKAAARRTAVAPAASEAPQAQEGRIRWTKMAGSVESVDLPAGRLWVKARTKGAKSRDFSLTEVSVIIRDKRPAKLSDIRPGDKVRLLRYNSANREIKKIELTAASFH